MAPVKRGRRRTRTAEVAIVGPNPAVAREAAAWLSRDFPGAHLRPLSLSGYCARRGAPLPLVLAAAGLDLAADRRFLLAARERLLWSPASGDLYDAIAGVLTHLPERRVARAQSRGPATALLLEGDLTRERARAALGSPARHWIVEHVGRVRLPLGEIETLSAQGVRWSALQEVQLLGIAARKAPPRGIFPRGTRLFRPPERVRGAPRASNRGD